nr:reverse transcriptase domain-containing protein [Tanacetum cinerariifolium]
MDEFHGRKVTISIQHNHKKINSKENPGSSVRSSQNTKIPSDWQNDHITKQHGYSAKMQNGRLLKWRFELEEHDIQYTPRTSIKGKILADFIVERLEGNSLDTPIKDEEKLPEPGYCSKTDHHA